MEQRELGKKARRIGAFVGMVVASLALASMATAATVYTNQPGSVCKNFYPGEVGNMDYYRNGIRSTKTSVTTIVCPLVRPSAFNNQGADFYVDVNHNGTQTTSCTAYSHKPGGVLVASTSSSRTGSGIGYVYLNLRGAGKSDYTTDYTIVCTIAGSRNALVSGVHSVEF